MATLRGLDRFLQAQEGVYPHAVAELRAGRKRSHWMWFVFPQLAGLGRSSTAQYYAIRDLGEAVGYLEHEVLGARLRECAGVLTSLPGRDAAAVFGPVDARKLRSSMTLFEKAAAECGTGGPEPFASVLRQYFDAERDVATLELLSGATGLDNGGEVRFNG